MELNKKTKKIMKHLKMFESFLNESFWVNTTDYKSSDNNGESFLNVPGVPGGNINVPDFLSPIQADLEETQGKITNKIVANAKKYFKGICSSDDYNSLMRDLRKPVEWWLNFLNNDNYQDGPDNTYEYSGAAYFIWWLNNNIGKTIKDKLSY